MPFYDTLSSQRYVLTRTHCANGCQISLFLSTPKKDALKNG